MTEDRYAHLELVVDKTETFPTGSRNIAKLLQDWGFGRQPQEVMVVVAYDLNGHIRTVLEVSRGSHSDMHVSIQALMTAVLGTGAIAFTIAHNHPTLDLRPSLSDVDLTHKVMDAANACSLIFEEHLILGPGDGYFSCVDGGLLIPAKRSGGKPARAAAKGQHG